MNDCGRPLLGGAYRRAPTQSGDESPSDLRARQACQLGRHQRLETAMEDGRVISPREVYKELVYQDDDLAKWTKQRPAAFVEPSEAVQREAGAIELTLPSPGIRDVADPWVVAEAKLRGLTVVTYEGTSFGGRPTRRWHRQMPGICQHHTVPCVTLPEALESLGGSF